MDLKDKVIVITGGASGLGRASAAYMVREKGARVALFDLNDEAGAAIVAELGGARASYHRVDVSDETAVAQAVATVAAHFGRIDICINCAGIGAPMRILDKQGQPAGCTKFSQTVAVNLIGSFNVMAHCVAAMARNAPASNGERGVVVNISSGAAYDGQVGQSAYSASKAGVVGLSLPAARELSGLGIRVNAIAPGLFDTPLLRTLPEPLRDKLLAAVEFPKRFGDMDEFAQACAFLCENGYANGECLRLDGAARLAAR